MKPKNSDGLRYPSIDDLLEKIPSKYQLAYTAAKRAKTIKEEEYSSMEEEGGNLCHTEVGMALEEVLNDKIEVEFAETAEDAITEDQEEISADTEDTF